jgi:ABC-2 type transport system permease protein
MTNLLYTEWLKIRKYRAFWWMTGIIALSYPGINYIFYTVYQEMMNKGDASSQLVKMLVGNPFTFPGVWHTVAYASSLFTFIPAVAVIMFITNEYTFKTQRQNIIDGWSRRQFMTAKLMDVLMITVLVVLMYLTVALIIGTVSQSDGASAGSWENSKYIGLFALQTFSQLSIAFLFAFLARKAFIALGAFLFYSIILEPMASSYLRHKMNDEGRFFPLEISDRLVPVPAFIGRFDEEKYKVLIESVNTHIIYTLILTALVWLICYRLQEKRDL